MPSYQLFQERGCEMMLKIDSHSLGLVPEGPGCYWLLAVTDDCSPKSVGRVAGTDHHGIFYIGQSTNLRARFKEMLKQFSRQTSEISVVAKEGHPASYEWHVSSQNKVEHPLESIRYTFEELAPGEDTVYRELVYLCNYREQFGEYPPWNQAPGKYKPYLPPDNPKGYAPFRYDPSCLTWLPPAFR